MSTPMPVAPAATLPRVALTMSPIHLIGGPILEFTAEVRVTPKIGIAAIAGKGVVHVEQYATVPAWELGASARYYAIGSFRRGVQVGAEVLFAHIDADEFQSGAVGKGVSIGPFVGYKYTHPIGFTFDGQLGLTYLGARAESGEASASERKLWPLLNLNVGWSF